MKIAIIGCGEVGRIYARAAHEVFEVELCDSFPTPAAEDLAAEFGKELHAAPGRWTTDVSQVWSCVTGEAALAAVNQVLEFLEPGAAFVDMSTASAADKRAGAALCADKGVDYVDVAIMGAVGLAGAKTNLLLAGDTAEVASSLKSVGAQVKTLHASKPGDAITLKLLRTVLTKGLEALGVEALVAAEAQGVREQLYDVLADIDEAGFTSFLNAVVTSHVTHAERKLHEVNRAISQLKEDDLPASVIAGAKCRYAQTSRARTEDPPSAAEAESINGAVTWLLRTARNGQHNTV